MRFYSSIWALAFLPGLILHAPAFGQGQTGDDDLLDEIIVSAQKREQDIQDVGIAITALTGNQLVKMGFTRTQDIIQQVPGLMLQQTRGSWIVRGVGSQVQGMDNEAATSLYIDDMYFYWMEGSNQMMFDMAQVEVLKGPQGTLFGRNATGGLIHFRTKNPTRDFDGFVDVTYGDYDQSRVELAFGGPISDKVSGRISAMSNKADGYVNGRDIDTNEIISDFEQQDNQAVRGKLLIEPSDEWQINLSAYATEQDVGGGSTRAHRVSAFNPATGLGEIVTDPSVTDVFGWRNPEGFDPFNVWIDAEPVERLKATGASARFDWDRDDGSLGFSSITGYLHGERQYVEDGDAGPFYILRLGNGNGEPRLWSETTQLTQEFLLRGSTDRMTWQTGVFLFDVDNDDRDRQFWFADSCSCTEGKNSIESQSLFAQVEYSLSDNWRGIFGLRYTNEDKENNSVDWEEPLPVNSGPRSGETVSNRKRSMDSPWSWRVAFEYFPSDSVLTYFSYNRGIKSGGFNSIDDFFPEFEDEKLDAFEVGAKWSLPNGNATLNAAVFYYDYKGYQIRTLDPDFEISSINADARVTGAEIEYRVTPNENLDISLGVSLLDAAVLDIARVHPRTSELIIYKEREMQQSPGYTFNGAINYGIPVGVGVIDLHFSWNQVDDQHYSEYNHPSMIQDSYLYGFGSIGYRRDAWELKAWVRNAFDEVYFKGGDDVSDVGFTVWPLNPPRWWGLTFRYNFGV